MSKFPFLRSGFVDGLRRKFIVFNLIIVITIERSISERVLEGHVERVELLPIPYLLFALQVELLLARIQLHFEM